MIQSKWFRRLAVMAFVLAWGVVMLGAYTRLTHAGLGCPDWPGCYGHLVLPQQPTALHHAQQAFPDIPIESKKAWTEMIHRYAAGTLGLLIVTLTVLLFRQKAVPTKAKWAGVFLVALLIGQALLGMWTVTLKLLPVVVMSHLLGGMLMCACLGLLVMHAYMPTHPSTAAWKWGALAGVVLVFVQIALGGWVSANYAGIACIGFPQCNGQWWPTLHLADGFNLLSPVGVNYQGGQLDSQTRMSIQFIHRLGAGVVFLYVSTFALLALFRQSVCMVKGLALLLLVLVMVQLTLGVMNVVYILPLPVAVAHNGGAALLFAVMFMMFYQLSGKRRGQYD